MLLRRLALTVALATGAGPALSQVPFSVPGDLDDLPDSEVEARLDFLTERLDAGRFSAAAWQYGWSGFYAVGTLTNGIQLLTAGDTDGRVVSLVDGLKSVGALAVLVTDPLPARLGADPVRAVPESASRYRLAVGERQLVENYVRAESRYSLQRHLEGVTTNLIGGAFIWAFGDSSDALRSTLVGIAVGEAQIWSQPWRASGDLRDYRAAFPATLANLEWELRPMGTGVQLAFRF
jgi:hypothetical protein